MPGYIPRGLLSQIPSQSPDWQLSTRPAMLPFLGEYTNMATGQRAGDFAWPLAITEPLGALARLIGTPTHPGTFVYGPDYGVASDNPARSIFPNRRDMTTLLDATAGGAGHGGMALEARALPPLADQMQALYRTARHPFENSVLHDSTALSQWAQIARLQQEIREGEGRWAAENHLLNLLDRENGRPNAGIFNDESAAPLSPYDTAALNQMLRKRMVGEGALYANGASNPAIMAISPSALPAENDGLSGLSDYARGGVVLGLAGLRASQHRRAFRSRTSKH